MKWFKCFFFFHDKNFHYCVDRMGHDKLILKCEKCGKIFKVVDL